MAVLSSWNGKRNGQIVYSQGKGIIVNKACTFQFVNIYFKHFSQKEFIVKVFEEKHLLIM